MTNSQINLIEHFIADSASESDLQEIISLLDCDAAFREALVAAIEAEGIIRAGAQGTAAWEAMSHRLDVSLHGGCVALEDRVLAELERVEAPPSPLRWRWLAVAAAAAVLVGFFLLPPGNEIVEEGAPVAANDLHLLDWTVQSSDGFLQKVLDPQWHGDGPFPQPGDPIASHKRIRLTSGVAQLQIDGVRVVVQGPVEFEILEGRRVRLNAGRLVATIHDNRPFVVETPLVDAVDLGTVFAVEVGPHVRTEVHVFEGQVGIAPSGATAGGNTPEFSSVLAHGQAQRFTNATLLDQVPVMESDYFRFTTGLPDMHGIVSTAGGVHTRKDMPVGEPTWEDRRHIAVVHEASNVVLPSDRKATFSAPGINNRPDRSEVTIPAGTRVDSYMFQMGPGDTSDREVFVGGTVRFARPIVGVLAGSKMIDATDADVGYDTYKKNGRGLAEHEQLSISPDRKSLALDLRCHGLDQIRVFVEAEGDLKIDE